uniref:Uncharacterized protein n=1 Tax=Arundo donax TaxID=35708 RepID=A0A0A9C8D2_ARUDO
MNFHFRFVPKKHEAQNKFARATYEYNVKIPLAADCWRNISNYPPALKLSE